MLPLAEKIQHSGRSLTLGNIAKILDADILCCENQLEETISNCFAADLMSDVLAYAQPNTILITGLATHQSVHTAIVADLKAIVYIRGKSIDSSIIQRATTQKLPIIRTKLHMFEVCHTLYIAGLRGME